jgi:hypothetical protein
MDSRRILVGMDVTSHIGVRLIFERAGVSNVSEGIYTRPPSTLPVHERPSFALTDRAQFRVLFCPGSLSR